MGMLILFQLLRAACNPRGSSALNNDTRRSPLNLSWYRRSRQKTKCGSGLLLSGAMRRNYRAIFCQASSMQVHRFQVMLHRRCRPASFLRQSRFPKAAGKRSTSLQMLHKTAHLPGLLRPVPLKPRQTFRTCASAKESNAAVGTRESSREQGRPDAKKVLLELQRLKAQKDKLREQLAERERSLRKTAKQSVRPSPEEEEGAISSGLSAGKLPLISSMQWAPHIFLEVPHQRLR